MRTDILKAGFSSSAIALPIAFITPKVIADPYMTAAATGGALLAMVQAAISIFQLRRHLTEKRIGSVYEAIAVTEEETQSLIRSRCYYEKELRRRKAALIEMEKDKDALAFEKMKASFKSVVAGVCQAVGLAVKIGPSVLTSLNANPIKSDFANAIIGGVGGTIADQDYSTWRTLTPHERLKVFMNSASNKLVEISAKIEENERKAAMLNRLLHRLILKKNNLDRRKSFWLSRQVWIASIGTTLVATGIRTLVGG